MNCHQSVRPFQTTRKEDNKPKFPRPLICGSVVVVPEAFRIADSPDWSVRVTVHYPRRVGRAGRSVFMSKTLDYFEKAGLRLTKNVAIQGAIVLGEELATRTHDLLQAECREPD